MSGHSSRSTEDIGWHFGIAVDGNKKQVQCKFCAKIIKGGITRLKQHLAHKTGDVAPCPQVSADVKRDMNKLLQEFKEKKKEKVRRTRDLEEEITRSITQIDVNDDDDDDEQLAYGRYLSRQQQQFDHDQQAFRASRGTFYNEGGSSQAFMRRSASVREGGSRGKGSAFTPLSTPAERLKAVEVELEKDRSRTKQAKVNSSWLKIGAKKLLKAWGSWAVDNNQPFTVVDSIYTNPLMETIREVGGDVRAPSSYELAEIYLPEACEEIKQWISRFANMWKERGVTIMCDGWSSMTRYNIINFLIYSNGITVYHKSVDASHVVRKDTEYYFKLMKKVVEEVGAEKVVHVVTDNASAMKAAGQRLMEEYPTIYWTPCAAHCLDLILEDLAAKTSIGAVIDTAKKISTFIYKYDWAVNYMKKFTNGRDIVRPGITRFATHFVSLESIVKHKTALRDMWESSEWRNSRYGKMKDASAKEVRELILSSTPEALKFWSRANGVLKVHEPLVKVLRLVDGDDKPTMGYIYEAMDRAKLSIRDNCRYFQRYWDIIDARWNFQLHTDLHAAGYYFNPQFTYRENQQGIDAEVRIGVRNAITRLEPDIERQVRAMNQLFLYEQGQDTFGTPLVERAIRNTMPAEWWITHGGCAPELQRIAVRVLSQTTSASRCERNWSMFSQVHTKTRNRLTYRKLNLIVYLRYNQKLKLRSIGRRSQEQLTDSFTPIDLDNIFDDNDPINLWLSEKEPPAFEEDEFPWLNVDEQEENDRINIDDDDDDRQLGVTPPFRYSVDQASEGTHNSGSGDDLTPLNSGDGSAGGGESGDGGDGGYGGAYHGGTSQSSRPSSRDINATLSDHNDRRSQEYEEETIAHTFRRLRKAKDKSTRMQPHCADVAAHGYTDDQQMPPSFTMPAHCNWSCGSDSYDGGPDNYGYTGSLEPHLGTSSYSSQPSYPGSEPHLSPFNPSSQNQDHFQIFNHGTINYGDHHYYRPTIHGGDSSSSGQSWRDATSSYFFDEQGTDTGYTADQSEDNNYQEPARHSFWW